MADANHATCPRCGATLPADAPVDLCPRCLVFDPQSDKKAARPVSPSPPGRARRKLILASVVLALGAILVGGLWSAYRWAAACTAFFPALSSR